MKREDVLIFEGKKIKLVLNTNFVLCGVVEKVNDDTIVFSTNQARSLIRINNIEQIIEKNEWRR